MTHERSRLTLDLDPSLHNAVKILAARKGTSMRQFCVEALELHVKEETSEYLTAEEAPLLAALWDNEEDAVYDNA